MKLIFHYLITLIALVLSISNAIAQPIGTAIIHDKLSSTDSTLLNQRMMLNGITSTCDSPKVGCPGHFGNTGVYYRCYCYTNESVSSECINVMLEVNCQTQIFCAAYLGSFDPSNVALNYLADPGLSIANSGSDSMSFTVPAGAKYCIVVNEIHSADTCEDYTLKISQFATSWHGSIDTADSTQTQRLDLDAVRAECNHPKQLCAKPPKPGMVYHDGYLYNNTTPNDICIRATLYQHCTDSLSELTSAAYLNSYDSTDACYNLAADPGVYVQGNDSLWYSFLVPSGSNCFVIVYSQKDTLLCEDYVMKLEADFTVGAEDAIANKTSVQLFPNPVFQGDNLIIAYDDLRNASLEIYDATGRKVITKKLDDLLPQLIIPTSSLTSGIYLVKVRGANKSVIEKFIVE